MCGISGVVGLNNISEALSQGIRNLEYRGYDSCGIALIKKNNLVVRKNTGGVDEFFRKNDILSEKSTIGIAHTRWATHGSVTHENSHPFVSCDEAFAVVHNGIISNYRLLREDLIDEGHKFYSETDTEVIPHLLEKYYKKYKNVETAFLSTLNVLEGTFAIVLISSYHPGQIFCARRESPLMIGIGDEQKFVGSDFNAFIDYTKNAIIIEDGEYAIISRDSYVVKSFLTREEVVKSITKIEWDSETAKKGGYPHYMLKEIYEQPQTINTALELDSSLMDQMVDTIHERKNTYFVGVGTTFYVAQFANYLFSSLSDRFIPAISSDEFISLAKVNNDSLVFALSQSGETFDTIRALKFAKSQGAKTAAIVNVMGSSISRQVDNVILQGSGPEISVISTKAAFAQMITMALLALKLGLKNKTIKRKEYDQSINALSEL
ncbi:MAG: glutamine--fructose-6-phosphate transaminase (isomerizing), partial [Nitrospinaceae bacterium]